MTADERVWLYRRQAHDLTAAELRSRIRTARQRIAGCYGPVRELAAMVEAYDAELAARQRALEAM